MGMLTKRSVVALVLVIMVSGCGSIDSEPSVADVLVSGDSLLCSFQMHFLTEPYTQTIMLSDNHLYLTTVDQRNGIREIWMSEDRMIRQPHAHDAFKENDSQLLLSLSENGCDLVYSSDRGYAHFIESLARDDADPINHELYSLLTTRDVTITELVESVSLENLVCTRMPGYALGNVCEIEEANEIIAALKS
jgi:hypothetical protein